MTSSTSASTPPRPWQHEPWFWFVWGLPAVAVVGSVIAAILAIHGADRLVDEDYYRRGVAIGVDIAHQRAAAALGLRAELYSPERADASAIAVVIHGTGVTPAPLHLAVRLVDPGHQRPDLVATLLRSALTADQHGATYRGRWQSPLPTDVAQPPITWRVTLESDAWRIDGEIDMPASDATTDGPAPFGAVREIRAAPSAS